MPWGCNRCGRVMAENPQECPNCGHHIFRQVARENLPPNESDGPQSINPDELGRMSQPAASTPSDQSPDGGPDGSASTSEETDDDQRDAWDRLRGWLPFY